MLGSRWHWCCRRATLDWLNKITDDSFRFFFGLEMELWRIVDSPVAPKFNIVSKPTTGGTRLHKLRGQGR